MPNISVWIYSGKPFPCFGGLSTKHPFGDGGDDLRCQISGGAKMDGLRDSTGLLDRLEDPVDDAAVVMPIPRRRC
jgi:hypothetical protein